MQDPSRSRSLDFVKRLLLNQNKIHFFSVEPKRERVKGLFSWFSFSLKSCIQYFIIFLKK
ncbi:hypothetical protein Hac_0707 [Helicobacter acinonychis str. Sheeba]|uniref:Uncharacterized protein n=1 Tax=Helicobacter acinonychis (strain Sheeba) TaxID=382638 RepID=Q17XW6_HELAH|nr:hypothetical protein Hac_0707 [Helicobacter acinonychis str. Sheeba]